MTAVGPVRGARLLLDADVLFPIRICDFILTASTNGLFQRPIVSELILAEAIRNVIADLPDLDEARVQRRFANVRVATDGHGIVVQRRFVDEVIVNEKDRHVVAAAIFNSVAFVVMTEGTHNQPRARRRED